MDNWKIVNTLVKNFKQNLGEPLYYTKAEINAAIKRAWKVITKEYANFNESHKQKSIDGVVNHVKIQLEQHVKDYRDEIKEYKQTIKEELKTEAGRARVNNRLMRLKKASFPKITIEEREKEKQVILPILRAVGVPLITRASRDKQRRTALIV